MMLTNAPDANAALWHYTVWNVEGGRWKVEVWKLQNGKAVIQNKIQKIQISYSLVNRFTL
jgi:hypothetical protein